MDEIEDLAGDDMSVAELFGEIMGELRLLSTLYMKTNPPEVTLQPTVIVSEAFVRLANHRPDQFKDEDDFKATASVILRQVFAERAKKRLEEKQRAEKIAAERKATKAAPGSAPEPELPSFEGASPELAVALENALEALSEVDDRSAGDDRLQPKRPDEQLCTSCFLLVRDSAPVCPVGDDACPIFSGR